MQYQGFSLCTGILGFELGMQLTGLNRHIDIRQCVEINPYCQQLIKLRLPGVPIWGDLTTYVPPDDIESDRTIIWSGFPCQPVSQAGKQRGDKDKRYLWPHILRLIRQVRPIVWLGENVDGLRTIDSGWLFGSILEGLAESGYCVEWSCVSAFEVGAVHKRERVWLLAYRPEALGVGNSLSWPQSAIKTDAIGTGRATWMESEGCDCGDRAGDLPTPADTESWQLPIQQNQWSNSASQKAWSNPAFVGSGAESTYFSSEGYQRGIGEGISRAGRELQLANLPRDWHQNAQSLLCRSNDGIPADVDGYLLRHDNLEQWLTAATIPTFTRLTSEETRSLSREDRQEYKQLLAEYHRTKKQYEQWLEALGNAICPHQAAIAWHRVGQILGLQ